MTEMVVKDWNKIVGPDDIVWHLGDFAMWGMKAVFEIVPWLNGKINLVFGNHCPPFPLDSPKKLRQRDEYLEHGFMSVQMNKELILTNGDISINVFLIHFPPRHEEQKQYDDRYWEYRVDYDPSKYLIHGHLHNKYLKWNNCVDAGWDNLFRPYTEIEVVNLLLDERTFIPSRLTEWYKERELEKREKLP